MPMTDDERSRILGCEIETVNVAIEEAVALAIEEHRRLGNPIVIWRDGRVVWIQPEDITPYSPPPRRGV